MHLEVLPKSLSPWVLSFQSAHLILSSFTKDPAAQQLPVSALRWVRAADVPQSSGVFSTNGGWEVGMLLGRINSVIYSFTQSICFSVRHPETTLLFLPNLSLKILFQTFSFRDEAVSRESTEAVPSHMTFLLLKSNCLLLCSPLLSALQSCFPQLAFVPLSPIERLGSWRKIRSLALRSLIKSLSLLSMLWVWNQDCTVHCSRKASTATSNPLEG